MRKPIRKKNKWLLGVTAFVFFGVLAGLLIAGEIVRREGFEGLWRRKRNAVETIKPESAPLVDKMEDKLGIEPGRGEGK